MSLATPTFEVERVLLNHHEVVIGLDEVGRGAIAGLVAVGAVVVGAAEVAAPVPEGLRDSKLLTAAARERLVPALIEWVPARAVGWATAREIDEFGICASLAAAAKRALAQLWDAGVPVAAGGVLLDGSHDWLSGALASPVAVILRPKADRDCGSVAAASVLAKVARDAHLCELAAHPNYVPYGWERNKGYGSVAHRDAIREYGASAQHRRTWLHRILGEGPDVPMPTPPVST